MAIPQERMSSRMKYAQTQPKVSIKSLHKYFALCSILWLYSYFYTFISDKEIVGTPPVFSALWITLLVFLAVFCGREVIQVYTDPSAYVKSLENWVELAVILLTSLVTLWGGYCEHVEYKRKFAAFSMIPSWWLLLTMTGRSRSKNIKIYYSMYSQVRYIK